MDHCLRKFAGAKRDKGGIERHLVQLFDALLGQLVRARLGVHQAKGRGVGGEQLAGMRLERHQAKRRAKLRRGTPGCVDHGAMAQMNAVKIANGGGGTAVGGIKIECVTNDAHSDCVARCGTRRKVRAGQGLASVELARRCQHDGLACEDFFAVHEAAGVQCDLALGVVDCGDFNFCRDHVAGAHGG